MDRIVAELREDPATPPHNIPRLLPAATSQLLTLPPGGPWLRLGSGIAPTNWLCQRSSGTTLSEVKVFSNRLPFARVRIPLHGDCIVRQLHDSASPVAQLLDDIDNRKTRILHDDYNYETDRVNIDSRPPPPHLWPTPAGPAAWCYAPWGCHSL